MAIVTTEAVVAFSIFVYSLIYILLIFSNRFGKARGGHAPSHPPNGSPWVQIIIRCHHFLEIKFRN